MSGGKPIDQGGAALAGFAIDDHGAGAADFFEASAVVDHRGRGFAFGGRGVGGNVLQAGDNVHVWPTWDGKFLPPGWLAGSILPANPQRHGAV